MSPAAAERGLFTIPPGLAFADILAQGLLDETAGEPLALADMLILLPNRRACRALREAFLRLSGGRPLLLPRMRPLGEQDEDELLLADGGALDLPPALEPLERVLLLARLVTAMGGGRGGQTPAPDQAARLAAELAALLDGVQAERLDLARLERLVPDDYAEHWQATLKFLEIITDAWPVILAERGALDPAERRNRVLAAQAARWRAQPPRTPVIAAGTTGSLPAVAELLAVIAALPRGRVVLPGLDQDMDQASWEALPQDPAHPQHGLNRLLARLGAERASVRPFAATVANPRLGRMALLAEALRPAATCEAWRDLAALSSAFGTPERTLSQVSRLDAPTPHEEAGAIALMLRQAVEEPGRTAALVTPDRALAARVAAELERWDIRIDDSAGRPLAATEPGAFLRLSAAMVAEQFAPHALLACLKHPLAAGGRETAQFRARTRALEQAVLRGPRPPPGLSALGQRLKDGSLRRWLEELALLAAPFTAAMAQDAVPLADLVRLHMEFAESLAADARLPGPARLWRGEDGEAAAAFAARLAQAAPALGSIAPACYPALLDELMAPETVRPVWGRHPRLHIWGPLEARLQQADLMILGGLNEGTWPPQPDADPWMSRPMRERFGLPPFERRVGLSAHDFVQAMGAPQVVLSRSLRVDGTPTVPSRWLLRLEAVMQATGLTFAEDGGAWVAWHALLDRPAATIAVPPPAPCPPVAARPRRLSVTAVERWMRDPYAIYAQYVLGLRALKPIDADPSAADYGELVHESLERFLRAFPKALPADPEAALLAIGREVFEQAMAAPGIWAFWWPRFESIARWVAAQERARRPLLAAIHCEETGALEVDAPFAPFTVTAKADRIDRMKDGSLELIDYKTGTPPSAKEVAAGYAPQLPLEAAIARHGGFAAIGAGEPSRLTYWRLKGGPEGGEERPAGPDAVRLADEALAGLKALVAVFDRPDTPYAARPHPEHAPKYSDYLHLARVREWATAGQDGEE